MTQTEEMEQFRAVMLRTMSILKEVLKDIYKLQAHVLALRNSLTALVPEYEEHFQKVLVSVEKSLTDQKSSTEKQIGELLDQALGILKPNRKAEN